MVTEAKIINGKAIADRMVWSLHEQICEFTKCSGIVPGLAVVLVGENPASEIYVRNKVRRAREAGIVSLKRKLPTDVSETALLDVIDELNQNAEVHGILVQLPLPAHIDAYKVLNCIRLEKDVDGFHPTNVGRLALGIDALLPCTPYAIFCLIKTVMPNIAGAGVVVLGRSNIVGKPIAQLLLAADATVTLTHSKTTKLPEISRQADILIAAIGRPEFVRGDWIKPGAVVIDVGINRINRIDAAKPTIVGDVAYDEVKAIASAITPVPGGVGPMTIACLLENTFTAARHAFPTIKVA